MDEIKFTILADGTLKIETGRVSMPNHINAESFLREVAKLQGGKVEIKHKHGHAHHGHAHSHGEQQHQH